MNPNQWSEERFQLALKAVEQACRLSRDLQDKLGGDFYSKLDSSPVTLADLSVQALVGLQVREKFPQDSLLGEETAETLSEAVLNLIKKAVEPYCGPVDSARLLACFQVSPRAERRWILDPIDGTKGFLRGDQFAVALAHQNGEDMEFGLLGCPRLADKAPERGEGCIGAAYRGRGSWQKPLGSADWRQIKTSGRDDVTQTRLLRSFEASHTNETEIENLVKNLQIKADPVLMDSQAKCLLLARGEAEVVIRCLSPKKPNYKEKLWDQAAGWMLITEAGGKVTDLAGKDLDFSGESRLENNSGILGSNGILQQQLLAGLVADE